MPSVLVFGATGAVGRFLLPQLVARDEQVFAVSRQPQPDANADARIQWLRGDLFAEMTSLPVIDTIYSLGPLDGFAQWFDRAPPARVRRIIAFSSMSAQSKRESVDPAERELAVRLQESESRLLRAGGVHGVACTLFRPTLIYGAGLDRSLAPIARAALRWRVLPIPYGAEGLRQPVHAADLADACVAVRDCAAAYGIIYALGGGEQLRFDAMLARVCAALPRRALPLPIPMAALRLMTPLIARRGLGAGALARMRVALTADNAPATRDFGYAPRKFLARDVLGAPFADASDKNIHSEKV